MARPLICILEAGGHQRHTYSSPADAIPSVADTARSALRADLQGRLMEKGVVQMLPSGQEVRASNHTLN